MCTRWPCQKPRTILALFCICYILAYGWFTLSESHCQVPVLLLSSRLIALAMTLILAIFDLGRQDLPHQDREKRKIEIFMFSCMNMGLAVFGIVNGIRKAQDSLDCLVSNWALVILSFATGIIGFLPTFIGLRNWWRLYQFRRRKARLNRGPAEESDAVTLRLLGSPIANDNIGLFRSDIERLERRNFTQSLQDLFRFNYNDRCPICEIEFQSQEEVISLPKCNHMYHIDCANHFLTYPLCVLCRRNIRTALYGSERQSQENLVAEVQIDVGHAG